MVKSTFVRMKFMTAVALTTISIASTMFMPQFAVMLP